MTAAHKDIWTSYLPTELPSDRVDYVAKLKELRAARGEVALEQDWPADVLLPDLRHSGISQAARALDDVCATIDILEVYDGLSKGVYQDPRQRTAGAREIQVSCPIPDHPDTHPSASINPAKQLWHCHACMVGGDKYEMAGHAYGLNPKRELGIIKRRMAEDLRGMSFGSGAAHSVERHDLVGDAPGRADGGGQANPARDDPPLSWDQAVEERKNQTLIRLEGDTRARQERAAGLFEPPHFFDDLQSELAQPDPEVEWSINGLHAVGGNTTITAGFKVGKTTFVMNLVRSLADSEPFLGEVEVRSLTGRVGLWNFEVDQNQMRLNFREMGIRNLTRIWHLPLRGHHVNLMDDAAYKWAINELRRQEIEVLVLDPFSGAYYGDENDNSQINAFTKRLDELKREAGVTDLFMPVHTGRVVEEGNERARGGAKLDDWADNRWVLSKSSQSGDRYFKAEGRRVEQPERELRFDRSSHALSFSVFKGTRREKAGHALKGQVLAFIGANPGCSKGDIERAIGGRAEATRKVLKDLASDLDVVVLPGSNRSHRHYLQGQEPPGTRAPFTSSSQGVQI